MSFVNLEDQFLKKMEDLYSLKNNPVKDSSELHPIIFFTPDDLNRPQGVGNTDRLVPVARVITDQRRFARLLTSPVGLRFFIKQQLLQTGNVISETRILDPLFINKNLTPYVHSKRQLFDQTDITVNDPDRSPATTSEVGLAGRLQRQTGADVMSHIMGRKTARQTIVDVLASTQIGQTVTGLFNVTNGTYGINQRPEFDVSGRYYSGILYTGRKPLINRELDILIDALGVIGAGASIFGLPNIFAGLRGRSPLPATSNFSTGGSDPLGTMPYFNPEIPGVDPNEAGRYVQVRSTREPSELLSSILPSQVQNIINIGLRTIVRNLLGFNFGSARKYANVLSFRPTVSIGPEIALETDGELARLRKPERSMRQRYEQPDDPTTVLSSDARDRIQTTKSRLEQQAQELKSLHPDYAKLYSSRGIVGGITINDIDSFKDASTYKQHQEIRKNLPHHPSYHSDLLNQDGFTIIKGTTLPREVDGVSFPEDYIKVHFVDKANSRVIPFRAHIAGLTENVTTQYSTTRYIGRPEKNIVYTGADRSLSFTLYVHAWSPTELQFVWQRVNTLTGLAYPAKFSPDGFMIPPLVELTIGDFYKNQPGYIESIVHTIEDDTSWVIEPGTQVPQTVKMDITFAVIERFSMQATSPFYGFGVPVTRVAPTDRIPSRV